jgi:hypothetical protein
MPSPRVGKDPGASSRNVRLDRSTGDSAGCVDHLANRGTLAACKVYRKRFPTTD